MWRQPRLLAQNFTMMIDIKITHDLNENIIFHHAEKHDFTAIFYQIMMVETILNGRKVYLPGSVWTFELLSSLAGTIPNPPLGAPPPPPKLLPEPRQLNSHFWILFSTNRFRSFQNHRRLQTLLAVKRVEVQNSVESRIQYLPCRYSRWLAFYK